MLKNNTCPPPSSSLILAPSQIQGELQPAAQNAPANLQPLGGKSGRFTLRQMSPTFASNGFRLATALWQCQQKEKQLLPAAARTLTDC